MPKPVLGVDCDATVWNSPALYVDVARNEALQPHREEEVDSWSYLHDYYGDETANAIFHKALHPDNIPNRKLYPGCRNAIKSLKQEGVRIVFITHSFDPELVGKPVSDWLRLQFGQDVRVCVLNSSEPKIKLLQAIDALGMVDDKPSTIEDVAATDILPILPKHPYNVEQQFQSGIVSFDPATEWYKVPQVVARQVHKLARLAT